jgi:hypothetical protein
MHTATEPPEPYQFLTIGCSLALVHRPFSSWCLLSWDYAFPDQDWRYDGTVSVRVPTVVACRRITYPNHLYKSEAFQSPKVDICIQEAGGL